MLPTISSRMLAILAGFALLLCAGAVASEVFLRRQADDGLVVNLAGRQRMLTQKMSKESAELALLRATGNTDENVNANLRDQLQNTMRVFEMTLFALRDGGPAPLNLEITGVRLTPRATTTEIEQQLTKVASVWEPFKRDLTALMRSGGSETAAIRSVLSSNLVLMEQMNRAVSLMQRDAEQRVKILLYVQAALLGVGLSLVLAGVWVARASISRPLRELAVAAHSMSTGNLGVELRPSGTREVRELSASFERMRASMLATLGGRLGADAFDEAL